MNLSINKNSIFKLIPLLALILGLGCKSGGGDDNTDELLALYAVNQATQNSDVTSLSCETVSDPCMKICSQTVAVKSQSNANYYGSGKPAYTSNKYDLTLGSTNPIGQVFARQDHSYTSSSDYRPITFNWFDSSGTLFTGREGYGTLTGTTQHAYTINTKEYTGGNNKYDATSQVKYSASINVPDNTKNVSVVTTVGCTALTSEEKSFTPSVTSTSASGSSTTWSTSKKLKVNVIFIKGTYYPDQTANGISTALNKFIDIYNNNQVKVDITFTVTTYDDSEYLTITDPTTEDITKDSSLAKLYTESTSAQDTKSLNVFVTNTESSGIGLLGIAGGIPGNVKKGSSSSAVTFFIAPHRSTSKSGEVLTTSEQNIMGETMAHEAGHFLGLFHNTESPGYSSSSDSAVFLRDPITDSSYCDVSNEGPDSNTTVDSTECNGTSFSNSGALNLMFWGSLTSSQRNTQGLNQEALTGEQGWVIRSNPLVY